MIAYSIIIISLLSSAVGSETYIALFQDLLELYNMNHPMIICRNMNDMGLQELISSSKLAYTIVSYDKEGDIDYVLNKVRILQYSGDLDCILFVGNGHQPLIVNMTNSLKLFQSGITGIIPKTEYADLNLKT